MSTTFFVAGAGRKDVPLIGYDDEPILDEDTGEVVMESVSLLPELNMNGMNTNAVLSALGVVMENGCGEWALEQLPEIRRRILRALNGDVGEFTREATESLGEKLRRKINRDNGVTEIVTTGGCSIYTGGLSDEGLRSRLEILLKIVVSAQEHNSSVVFG